MVGNEKGNGYFSCIMPSVCNWPKCWCFGTQGAGLSKCCDTALESQPRADDADAEDQAATETGAAAGFHDPWRGRPFSMVRERDPTSGEVLSYRMVYGKP
jgi:hypothetical protein